VSENLPPSRWQQAFGGATSPYAERFEELLDAGEDVDGEARLADVLAPRRPARVLDAGAGIGRVAAGLAARGHDVTAVENDPDLVARSRARFPEIPVVDADILELSPAVLERAGRPTSYDVVVVVGNVMVYLAEDTEVRALRTLAGLLAPDGRILVGFHPVAGPPHSHDYPVETFLDHVAAADLELEHRFGTYQLTPPAEDYVVAVLRRRP
jgi:SAM-dependent methyltransferase